MMVKSKGTTVITALLERGKFEDALGEAARFGNLEFIRQIISLGIDPNVCNSLGWPVINLASSGGSSEAIALLLELGADPNQMEKESGEHSLFSCLWADHDRDTYERCCAALIRAGAFIDAVNCEGLSIESLAARRGMRLTNAPLKEA